MTDTSMNNPLVTKEDLVDHEAISALFYDNLFKRILLFNHIKYSFWTIPIGKVHKDQKIEDTLVQELKEELSIDVTHYFHLGKFTKTYVRAPGVLTEVTNHLYLVDGYDGDLVNNEPHKHSAMEWVHIKDLHYLKISDATKFALMFI